MHDDDCLYHYCSTQTFHSIIHNQTIRLSSLTLSNDALEGKVVSETVRRVIERQGTGRADMLAQIKTTETYAGNALGFCLSEDGDLLSQWRGYAMDGAGLCIGFSKEYLMQFTQPPNCEIGLTKVKYYEESEVMAEFERISQELDEEKAACYGNFRAHVSQRECYMYGVHAGKFTTKSDAFKEEREWRLHTGIEGNLFRETPNCLIPYIELSLKDPAKAILKVLMGPKHVTPKEVLENFLKKSKFTNVEVSKSRASYR